MLCKCIIVLLVSANLQTPLIKWYLEQLVHATQEMRQNYGLASDFRLDYSLKTLLVGCRYQKLGYIPESLLLMFRDFCAVVVYLEVRDRLSAALREYSRLGSAGSGVSEELVVERCVRIVEYGSAMLAFGGFFGGGGCGQVRDVVVSVIGRLTRTDRRLELGLERRLAVCVGMKTQEFNGKSICIY